MNDLSSKTSSQPPAEDLSQQVAALQRLTSTLLLGLAIVTAILTFFLWRIQRYTGFELSDTKVVYMPNLDNYYKIVKPADERFEAALVEFSRNNPDFAKLLANANLTLNTNLAPVAPKPAPASPK